MEKEKPFCCDICGKRYKNLNGLKYVRRQLPFRLATRVKLTFLLLAAQGTLCALQPGFQAHRPGPGSPRRSSRADGDGGQPSWHWRRPADDVVSGLTRPAIPCSSMAWHGGRPPADRRTLVQGQLRYRFSLSTLPVVDRREEMSSPALRGVVGFHHWPGRGRGCCVFWFSFWPGYTPDRRPAPFDDPGTYTTGEPPSTLFLFTPFRR